LGCWKRFPENFTLQKEKRMDFEYPENKCKTKTNAENEYKIKTKQINKQI